MSRKLTKKQRKFVNSYADTGNATLAAKESYDVSDDNTAAVIGHENLSKPQIQEELRKLGFDSNNAKRVVAEVLNNDDLEPKDRLKASELIFKVHGDYAPDKSVNINIDANSTDRTRELGNRLVRLLGRRN